MVQNEMFRSRSFGGYSFFITSLVVLLISITHFSEPAAIPDFCSSIPDEDKAQFPVCTAVADTAEPELTSSVVKGDDLAVAKELCPACDISELGNSVGTTNNNLFEGDIAGVDLATIGGSQDGQQANAIIDENKRWPNATVPYVIGLYLSNPKYTNLIKDAIEVFHKETCVRFVPRTNEDNYLYMTSGFGCNTYSGMLNQGRQGVSLAQNGCMKSGIIQHELMHALGFYHEQSRSDRDKYVDINWQNIIDNQQLQFKAYLDTEVTAFGQPYDFGSVLHYGRFDFAKDRKVWTIQPKQEFMDQVDKMGQRERLSPIDLTKINIMYKCPNSGLGACPSDPGWSEYNGKCYFFSLMGSQGKKTFVQARNFCMKLGAPIIPRSPSLVTAVILPRLNAASFDPSEPVWVAGCQSVTINTAPQPQDADSCEALLHFFCQKNLAKKNVRGA